MTTPSARPHRAVNKFAFMLLFVALLAQVSVAAAQIATGRVTGTVKDASGAVITGATLSLTNNATGVTITAPSTSTGTYLFEAVNPETYTLKAESPGFRGFTSPNIDIHIQQTNTVDVTLSPGAASEEITVESSAPLLQAEDASVGQTIDKRAIDNLPLSSRDWVSLGQLAPGVNTIPGQSTNSDYYTVNGTNYFQNDFRLNGIDDNIEVYGGSPSNASIIPPPDAIQEFKLQTGDFSAEFGHSTGAVINAVIKSGGNKVHGDLWEYLRNDKFNANDYFSKRTAGAKIPEYRQNQFGGTIGGPVFIPKLYDGRNKTFFFFDYQGGRFVNATPSTQTVPTPAMVASGFTNLQDLTNTDGTLLDGLNRKFPIVTVFDPSTTRLVGAGQVDPVSGIRNAPTKDYPAPAMDVMVRDPFYTGGSVFGIQDFSQKGSQLNILPAGRLSPAVIKLLQLYPAANRPGLQNNYFKNNKSTNTVNQYDVRIDQNIGTKDILFGAFDRAHSLLFTPQSLPGVADGQSYGTGNIDTPTYSVSVGYTHLFTASLTNEFHFGFNHLDSSTVPLEGNTLGLPAQYGIPGIPQFSGNGGLPAVTLNNFAGLGVSAYTPTIAHIHSIEYTDNVTRSYHSQTFKAGFQLDSIEGDITQPPYGKGVFTYDGRYTSLPNSGVSLTSISDALLIPSASTVTGIDSKGAPVKGTDNIGGLASYQGSNYAASNDHRYYFGAYFQDDWKATPNLTLNLGLRWDRTTPYAETRGRDANFVANGGGNGPGGIYYLPKKTCNVPSAFGALLAKDGIVIKCVDGLALGNAQYTNFAPRLGFAYRITPTFVVRGGYGIAYGALDNIGYGGTINANYPFEFNVGFNSPDAFHPLQLANGQTATIENGFSNINLSDPSQVSPNGLSLVGRQYNFQTPYTQTFNFTVQRQIGRFDSLQAGYVAALGRHLDIQGSHNSPSALAAPGADLGKSIPFPDFNANVAYETTNGASSYNSLQVVYARSASHGLSGNANYTLSKCLSNALEFGRSGSAYPRAQWLPGFGVGADNQPCDSDATHLIHVSGTYELPVGRGRQFLGSTNRLVDTVIGGWATNYIFTHQSGQPFTINCPATTVSFFICNAIRVPGQSLYSKVRNTDQWLNPNAFASPAVYGSGTADTGFASLGGQGNQARGSSLNVLDASVFKEFPIVEQIRLVFRAEAFNLANTPQFGLPNNNLDFRNYSPPANGNPNPSGFSSTTSLRGSPRTLQFALKLYY